MTLKPFCLIAAVSALGLFGCQNQYTRSYQADQKFSQTLVPVVAYSGNTQVIESTKVPDDVAAWTQKGYVVIGTSTAASNCWVKRGEVLGQAKLVHADVVIVKAKDASSVPSAQWSGDTAVYLRQLAGS